jgi:hypothetical protein
MELQVINMIACFPNQSFVKVGSGPQCKMRCQGCNKDLTPKKSIVEQHIYGASRKEGPDTQLVAHQRKLHKYNKRTAKDPTVLEALREHDAKFHAVGQSLEPHIRTGRVHALTTLLEAGIPIEKLNNLNFRTAMETAFKVPMTGSSHMGDLIPVVRSVQQRKLGEECTKDLYSAFWDGTTRVCEVFVFIVRTWIQSRVQHRLMECRFLDHSLTAPEQAGVIMSTALSSANPPLPLTKMLFQTVDACATNAATEPILRPVVHPANTMILCFSHFFANCGKQAQLQHVKTLVECLTALQVSGNAVSLFRQAFGAAPAGHSAVRWYCDYTQARQVFLGYPSLTTLYTALDASGTCPATSAKLGTLISVDEEQLKYQLATNEDALGPFAMACYDTESDAPDACFWVFERIQSLITHVSIQRGHNGNNPGMPNVRAVARAHIASHPHLSRLPAGAQDAQVDLVVVQQRLAVEPVFSYFETKLAEPESPSEPA